MTLSCSTEAVASASFLGKDWLKRTRTRIHTGGEGWQVGDQENLYILVSKGVVVRRTHASLASSVGPLGLRAPPGAPWGPPGGRTSGDTGGVRRSPHELLVEQWGGPRSLTTSILSWQEYKANIVPVGRLISALMLNRKAHRSGLLHPGLRLWLRTQ